jgi:glucosylceramidase
MLRDSYTKTIITTVCFQYQGEDVMGLIHQRFPNLRTYITELQCGGGDNVWSYPQSQTFPEIERGIDSGGISGAFQWNLLLCSVPNATYPKICGYSGMWQNTDGSLGNWPQQCMISIDTAGKKIAYNYQYYGLKHLTYYIRPGSKVLKVTGQYRTNEISVKNADGSVVVVTNNQNNSTQNIAICIGTQMVQATLPALSMASFVIYDSSLTSSVNPNLKAIPEDRFISVNKYFKIAGDKFSLPAEFEGKTCLGAIYDVNGRFVREFSMKNGIMSLSKDFGVSKGVYLVHVKAVHI